MNLTTMRKLEVCSQKHMIYSLQYMIKTYIDIANQRKAQGQDIASYVDILERIDQLHQAKIIITRYYLY